MKGESHKQVGCTREYKECDPGNIQFAPYWLGQLKRVAHHALNQWLLANKVAAEKSQSKQPVDDWCFPLQKSFAVKRQCQAAKYEAASQSKPLAFFQSELTISTAVALKIPPRVQL